MKLQYWGTSAAEAFPGIFCRCEACKRALKLGGKNIRTRSNALLDDCVMLDFSPDVNYNRLRYHYDMCNLKALCITHAHSDHLDVGDLLMHAPDPFTRNTGAHLPIFCSADAKQLIERGIKEDSGRKLDVTFTVWKAYQTEQITDTIRITPLPAHHAPNLICFIFLIQSGDKFFLYAHDTAFPEEGVFEFLKNYQLDGVSLDCNNGLYPSGTTHMGFEDVRRFEAKLRENGSLKDNAVKVINHFSHACDMTHEELEAAVNPYGFQVSWDGFEIEI